MCALGFVNRAQYNEVPLRVEYSLTEIGRTIIPPLMRLTNWSIDLMQGAGLTATCHGGSCCAAGL